MLPRRCGLRLTIVTITELLVATVVLAAPTDSGRVADPTPTVGMSKSLTVDFTTDPRKNLGVQGAVDWQANALTLGPGASMRQKLDLGSQVELTLNLKFQPLTDEGQTSVTRFVFPIRDRGEFAIVLTRRHEKGKTVGHIDLVDGDTPMADGKQIEKLHLYGSNPDNWKAGRERTQKVTQTIRAFQFQNDLPDGPWTFRHHYGLLTAYSGTQKLAVGYSDKAPGLYEGNPLDRLPFNNQFYSLFGVDEPLEVAGWSLEQQASTVTCTGVSGKASAPYRTTVELTPLKDARAHVDPALSEREDFSDLRARLDHVIWGESSQELLVLRSWDDGDQRRETISRRLGEDHPDFGLLLLGAGLQHQWGRRDEQALGLLQKGLAISEKTLGAWHPDCILAQSLLGRFYRETAKFDRAEPLLTSAMKGTAEVFGVENVHYALALQDLARLFEYTNRMAQAETLLRQAVDACPENKPRVRANARILLGELAARMSEHEKAQALFARAVDALAKLERQQPRRLPFETLYERSISIELAGARVQRGRAFLSSGDKVGARRAAQNAFFALSNPSGGHTKPNNWMRFAPDYSHVLISLADLWLALGDNDKAFSCVNLSDSAALGLTTRHDFAVVYRATAKLYEKLRDVGMARWVGVVSERNLLDLWVKHLIPTKAADEPARQAFIARLQAGESGRLEPLPKEKSDELMRKFYRQNKISPNLALDWHKIAVREFEWCSGKDHPETVSALLKEGSWIWKKNGANRAKSTFKEASIRAAAFAERVLPGLPEAQAYQYMEANKPVLDLLLSCYRDSTGDLDREAYESVWRAKSQATRQVMQRRQLLEAASGGPEVKRLAGELQATREGLAALSLAMPLGTSLTMQKELASLIRRKEDIERDLARLSDSFRRVGDSSRSSVAEMMHRVPAGAVVVDFIERKQHAAPSRAKGSPGTSRCYDAFVLRPTPGDPGWSVKWIDLGSADAIDVLLEKWEAGLRSRRGPAREHGDQVRRSLWTPLEAHLGGAQTVFVIPDGRLARVCWSALPGRRPNTFLIEDYALAQEPYGQHLAALLSESSLTGESALLVGGVDYGQGGKWSNLPGTASEVKQIQNLRHGPETIRLGDEAATRSRLVKMIPGRRYVHLATHGEFFDPAASKQQRNFRMVDSLSGGAVLDVTARDPMLLTMLVLAGANRATRVGTKGLPIDSDSYLTAEEVMGLDLQRTELVVLSACETGLGKLRGGEGAFSLQRAFHVGGSRAVVASLWQIPDKATQVLMIRFYDNLWSKKMSKLEALREAQTWMLREGIRQPELTRGLTVEEEQPVSNDGRLPPYYWAAFQLSGDWR